MKLRLAMLLSGLVALGGAARSAAGAAPVQTAATGDQVVRRALADELGRSMSDLVIPSSSRPYHIGYSVVDTDLLSVLAELGKTEIDQRLQMRRLLVSVRVGSPELDSSDSRDGLEVGTSVPLDDDYFALRHALWRSTDEQYKEALEAFARKKNQIRTQMADRADDYPDLAAEPPHQTVVPGPSVDLDAIRAEARTLADRASAVFAGAPGLLTGMATVLVHRTRRRLLTSDQTWADEAHVLASLSLFAQAQADDGMHLGFEQAVTLSAPGKLPSPDVVEAAARRLADRLLAARTAPLAENGTAVVLFEDAAAAQLMRALLVDRLDGSPPPRYLAGEDDSLASKLGLKVAAPLLDVYDDPTVSSGSDDSPLWGTYVADDEGVPARRVSLIERGVLKTLLMSRAPRKEIRASNGHFRLGRGVSIGNLFVSSRTRLSRKRLLDLARRKARAGGAATRVYVVRRLGSPRAFASPGGASPASAMGFEPPLRPRGGLAGIEAYLVSDHGEEPVRGLVLESLELRTLKDVIGVGDTPYVHNHLEMRAPASIVTPALLVEGVDVRRYTGQNPKLPSYPAP